MRLDFQKDRDERAHSKNGRPVAGWKGFRAFWAWLFPDARDGASIAAADGAGVDTGFCFFLVATL